MLNNVSRRRSEVGLTASPPSDLSLRPRYIPPITLIGQLTPDDRLTFAGDKTENRNDGGGVVEQLIRGNTWMKKSFFAVSAFLALSIVALGQGTGTLKGKLEGDKGKPIAGAVVRVMRSRDRSVMETQTDSAGKYSFQLVEDHYTVSFDAEGYQPVTLVSMQQVEEGKETEVKTVQLPKAKRTSLVRGAVFDPRGYGIPGATVKLERIPTEEETKSGKSIKSLRRDYITNSRGEFAFRLPPDRARYRVTAVRSGFKTDSKVVDVSESEAVPIAFTLEPNKP